MDEVGIYFADALTLGCIGVIPYDLHYLAVISMTKRTDLSQNEVSHSHIVSVRSLGKFVFQAGDLASCGFQRRDHAQLSTRGHQRVQGSRPQGYESEVEIAYQVEVLILPL